MRETQDYTFEVSLSSQKFDHKPNRETEVRKLRFYTIKTDIKGFERAIVNGYCYAPIFILSCFGMTDKKDENYVYSPFISIDIDHTQVEMMTMIDTLQYRPTIAYTSCNNGVNGESKYRFIYCFDERIEGVEEYYNYVYTILEANHISIDDIDKRSLKASQYYNGNGRGNCTVNTSYIVYSKNDFKDYYKDYSTLYKNRCTSNESVNLTNNTHTPTIISYNDTFVSKEFEHDYWNMKMEDVLSKYVNVYPNIERTPLPNVDEDTPYIIFPSDYIEIKRYWKIRNDGRAVKIQDGYHRRKNLFINGVIRRLINPTITFDNLLYNLLFELCNYISNYNAKYVIDKKDIYLIANNVMKADLSRGESLKGTDRKFMVNPKYCEKHGLNKRQVRNIACKMLRNTKIGELYDCSKTDNENLKVMKEFGLDISERTIKRWRKENGITKYSKKS